MFVRRVTRRNKDGSKVSYLQVVRSYRHPFTGQPRTEVVMNLGREDQLDRRSIRGLLTSLQELVGAGTKLAPAVAEPLLVQEARPGGVVIALEASWDRLGLGDVVRDALRAAPEAPPDFPRRVFVEVARRVVLDATGADPLDAAGIERFAVDAGLPPPSRCEGFRDLLTRVEAPLQQRMVGRTAPDEALFVVLRSLDGQEGRGALLPLDPTLATYAVATTATGAAVRTWVLPPGEPVELALRVVRDLASLLATPPVIVGHAASFPDEALARLAAARGGWFVGREATDADTVLSAPGRYRSVGGDIRVKQVGGAAGGRHLLVRHDDLSRVHERARDELLDHLTQEIDDDATCEACLVVGEHARGWVRCATAGGPRADDEAIRRAGRRVGRCVATTTAPGEPEHVVARVVAAIASAERLLAHRRASACGTSPTGPGTSDLIGILADAVRLELERACRAPAAEVLTELSRLYTVTVAASGRAWRLATEPSPAQRSLLTRLGIGLSIDLVADPREDG